MNVKKKLLLLGVLLTLGVAAVVTYSYASAAKVQKELVKKMGGLLVAEPDQYDAVIDEIMKASPTSADIVDAIRTGIMAETSPDRQKKLVAGWSEWTATDGQGVTRPYQMYVPQSIMKGASPTALIVHMHGGVGRPDFGSGQGTLQAIGYTSILWPNLADTEDLIIVCPVGRKECSWWLDNGVAHVDAVIRDVRRTIYFPEDSLFASGFSDGGSGCYYRAMAAPDPFVGFIALNGHPRVSAYASKKQIYLPNMAMTKTLAAMTQQDALYPSKSILPHILKALEFNADILTLSYPKMGHQPTYFEEQSAAVLNFIKTTKATERTHFRWYSANPKIGRIGRVAGVELLGFVSAEDAVELRDSNVMSTPEHLRFGVQFVPDTKKILMYSMKTAAATSGILQNDVFLKFDGRTFDDASALGELLAFKSPGESFTCTVLRKGKELKLTGQFPPFKSKPHYLRDRPTGFADCHFVQDDEPMIVLKTTNVNHLRVWLPEEMSSLSEIQVDHNGEAKEYSVVHLSPQEVLAEYAARGSQVPRAYVEIK